MTQEKDLKKVKVIIKETASGEKQRHYVDCAWLQYDANGNWLGQKCDCYNRSTEFQGWKMEDLAICVNESVGIFDKRLMARTNLKNEGLHYHCSQSCADSWKNH